MPIFSWVCLLRPEQLRQAAKLKWVHTTSAGVAPADVSRICAHRGSLSPTPAGCMPRRWPSTSPGCWWPWRGISQGRCASRRSEHGAQQEIWDGRSRPRELQRRGRLAGGLRRRRARRSRTLARVRHAHPGGDALGPGGAGCSRSACFSTAELKPALAEADYRDLAAPETPETHHLMGAEQLAAMKPSAILVNVARGSLVDQEALDRRS